MTIEPRHLATAQYSVVAIFLTASWVLLLSPVDRGLGQLQFIFSSGYENRVFFVSFAIATLAAMSFAVLFWLKRSASSLSAALAIAAVVMFALAVWQFDATLIFNFGLGCGLALWSWYAPNRVFESGRAKSGAP